MPVSPEYTSAQYPALHSPLARHVVHHRVSRRTEPLPAAPPAWHAGPRRTEPSHEPRAPSAPRPHVNSDPAAEPPSERGAGGPSTAPTAWGSACGPVVPVRHGPAGSGCTSHSPAIMFGMFPMGHIPCWHGRTTAGWGLRSTFHGKLGNPFFFVSVDEGGPYTHRPGGIRVSLRVEACCPVPQHRMFRILIHHRSPGMDSMLLLLSLTLSLSLSLCVCVCVCVCVGVYFFFERRPAS